VSVPVVLFALSVNEPLASVFVEPRAPTIETVTFFAGLPVLPVIEPRTR
jgi:hypothetical protein